MVDCPPEIATGGFSTVLVERERLLARLDDAQPGSVVVLSAGAGFGKSTLLGQWVERRHSPVAEVLIDADVIGAVEFGRRLTQSLLNAMPDSPALRDLHDRSTQSSPDWPRVLLPNLSRILGDLELTIVIDDVHLLTSADGRDMLRQLFKMMRAPSRLVVGGRNVEKFAIARQQVQGRMVLLGESDLSFTVDEVGQRIGVAATDVELLAKDVHQRTGGWPVGVDLLAASRHSAPVEGWCPTTSWTLSRFLVEEVFARLPVDQLRFLEEAAAIAPAAAELCDVVLERDDSTRQLHALAVGGVPMLAVSPPPMVVSMHALLRDELLSRLAIRAPRRATELRLRAAELLEADGRIEDALTYYLLAGDAERLDLFGYVRFGEAMLSGRNKTVEGWMEATYAVGGPDRPARVVARLSLAAIDGDLAAASYHLNRLIAFGDAMLPDGLTANQVVVLLSKLLGEAALSDGDGHNSHPGLEVWEVIRQVLISVKELIFGRLDSAERSLAKLAPTVTRWPLLEGYRLGMMAFVCAEEDRWDDGRRHLSDLTDLVTAHRTADHPYSFFSDSVSARYALHDGDVETAARHAERSLRTLSRFANGGPLGQRFLSLACIAEVRARAGDGAGAAVLLQACDELAKLWPDSPLVERTLQRAWSAARRAGSAGTLNPLSVAELRLLQFLPSHYTLPQIAASLFVAPSTVRTQVLAIYRKFGVSSRSAAVGQARQLGLLEA